jgi:hypothetical protein
MADVPLAQIVIAVLPDGTYRMSSTCWGRFDSSCIPLPDERAPAEVGKLLGELRRRLAGVPMWETPCTPR